MDISSKNKKSLIQEVFVKKSTLIEIFLIKIQFYQILN